MTADELVEMTLGRLGEFSTHFPSTRGPMYRRVGMRQRWLFARAGKMNPERYGTCATSALQTVSGARVIDLNDINGTNAPVPELIQKVTIENAGTSPYAVNDEVNIIGHDDPDAELAPRALLRDGLIIGYGTELDLVTSLKVHYPRVSALFTDSSKDTALELVAPYDSLLELDLAKWLVRKATTLSAEVRAAAVAGFEAEEKELLAEFDEQVVQYGPMLSRFATPRVVAKG